MSCPIKNDWGLDPLTCIGVDGNRPQQWFFHYKGTESGLFLRYLPIGGTHMPGRFLVLPGTYKPSWRQKVGADHLPYQPSGIWCFNKGEGDQSEIAMLERLSQGDECLFQVCPVSDPQFAPGPGLVHFGDTVIDYAEVTTQRIALDPSEAAQPQWFLHYGETQLGLYIHLTPPYEQEIRGRFHLIPGIYDPQHRQRVSCCAAPVRPQGVVSCLIGGRTAPISLFYSSLSGVSADDDCVICLYPIPCE